MTGGDDVEAHKSADDVRREADEVRDLATRGTALEDRVAGLEQAVAAARGRLDDDVLDEVSAVVDRTTGRLRLSARHTIVAIAGATGSGKSSTYNALVGLELSSIGVRRPTTSWATAVVWGSEGAEDVLEWLGIPPRYQTMRDSMLDTYREDNALDGVVLMDLPDHDSTEVAHHLEVDRLVELADLLVWVVDPQKYADAALHDRYLKPLAGHQGVMLVVVNHIDTIAEEKRDAMVEDVRRLLADDGLDRVTVLPVSAKHGIGMDALRREIADRVASKRATAARVDADLVAAARRLEESGGAAEPRDVAGSAVDELQRKVEEAAGVPVLVEAVERSVTGRARRAVTWPPLALIGRSEKGTLAEELGTAGDAGHALPSVAPVDRAAVRTAVRGISDDVGRDLSPTWSGVLRAAVTDRVEETSDLLDRRLAAVDLGVERLPGVATLLRVVQWLLLLTALGGAVWWVLSATAVVAEAPGVGGIPVPALLLAAGILLGLVLAVVGRVVVRGAARRRAEQADDALRAAVTETVRDEVVVPLEEASRDYREFRTGIRRALA